MKIFKTIFLILFIYIIQVTIISRFSLFTVSPDILLVTITLFAVSNGAEKGFALGVIGGILQDILGGTFFINMLTKGLLGFLVGTFKESIFGTEETVALTAVLVATITDFILYALLIFFFFNKPIATPASLLVMLILSCIYNCLLAPVMYPIIKGASRLLVEDQ